MTSLDRNWFLRPLFLRGQSGRVFALYIEPDKTADQGIALIFVPSFAEEMNRSRRMVTLQAQALAGRGIAVLILDLYGTGDSAGDFVDARWPIWLSDIEIAAEWVERDGREIVGLWGHRLGALLASQVSNTHAGKFRNVILWQPVANGRAALTQFLRSRVAASSMSKGKRESTAELRAMLEKGQSLEVAGYEISPELASAIDHARLSEYPLTSDKAVAWFELQSDIKQLPMSADKQDVLDRWNRSGVKTTVVSVVGPPFWLLEQSPLVPELISATENAACLRLI